MDELLTPANINVTDIIQIVDFILFNNGYTCIVDMNNDQSVDLYDIIYIINILVN